MFALVKLTGKARHFGQLCSAKVFCEQVNVKRDVTSLRGKNRIAMTDIRLALAWCGLSVFAHAVHSHHPNLSEASPQHGRQLKW